MKQRYRDLTHELCEEAVANALDGKWGRSDILDIVEKYVGIPRELILEEKRTSNMTLRCEAISAIAFEMEERIEELLGGDENALDLMPVRIKQQRDRATGKIRNIAKLDIMHQLFGHLAYCGLEPFLKARILPQQYASIPGRGQTGMLKKLKHCISSKKLGIRYVKKTDVHHAYDTTQYSCVIDILKRELPNAKWIITIMCALERNAPDGHLIIGGYIDAWIFNLLMSYALRYVNSLYTVRRGKRSKIVYTEAAYMDDFGLMGARLAGLRTAVTKLEKWLKQHYGLELKEMCKETAFLSMKEERDLKKQGKSAPGLDMGGYVVHRTYVSIRRTIYVRLRRQFLRAARELKTSGTIRVARARTIISYSGYFKRTNTRSAKETLEADKLIKIAKQVVKAHDSYDNRCKKEKRGNIQCLMPMLT